MKIGLGTVQFGLDYGISNVEGRTPAEEASRVLAVAEQKGIRIVDTAAVYGSSEEVLGSTLSPDHNFSLVTKTPQFSNPEILASDEELLEATFRRSLSRLRQTRIYGLLIHRATDLFAPGGERLMNRMRGLKDQGLVLKIGASVYTGDEIDRLLHSYSIDMIQLPINVLDQRLLKSGHLAKLKQRGIEVHARSAFLQGLLLMEPEKLPAHFEGVRHHLKWYHQYVGERGLTGIQAALGFVTAMDEIDCVICGVNNHGQLREICDSAYVNVRPDEFARFALDDESVLNPSQWRT